MLRQTTVCCFWRPKGYAQRVQPLLQGRAKFELKFARKKVVQTLMARTMQRTEPWRDRAIQRAAVNAAAREHGTDWAKFRIDIARQDVVLLPSTLRTLGTLEPMSFRAVAELAASGIAPPTPMSEKVKPQLPVLQQLDDDVRALQSKPSPLAKDGELRKAWKRYVVEEDAKL